MEKRTHRRASAVYGGISGVCIGGIGIPLAHYIVERLSLPLRLGDDILSPDRVAVFLSIVSLFSALIGWFVLGPIIFRRMVKLLPVGQKRMLSGEGDSSSQVADGDS